MRRHNARILAVLTLYNIDVNQLGFEDSLRCFENIQQVEMEYEYQVDIDYDFSRILVVSTMQNIEEIDKMIEKSLDILFDQINNGIYEEAKNKKISVKYQSGNTTKDY